MLETFLSTDWRWLVALLLFVSLWAFVANEKIGWALCFTVLLAALAFTVPTVALAFLSNPLYVALSVVGYVVLGVVWASIKWRWLVSKAYDKALAVRQQTLTDYGITDEHYFHGDGLGTPVLCGYRVVVLDYEKRMRKAFHPNDTRSERNTEDDARTPEYILQSIRRSVTPQVSGNKGRIMVWLMWWPLSATWFVVADMITDFYSWLRDVVGKQFQRHANSKFDNL